jgi:hypothetical protein
MQQRKFSSDPNFDYGYDDDAIGGGWHTRDLHGHWQLQQRSFSESDGDGDVDLVEYGGGYDCERNGHDLDSGIDDDYGVHEWGKQRAGYTDGDSACTGFDCGDASE